MAGATDTLAPLGTVVVLGRWLSSRVERRAGQVEKEVVAIAASASLSLSLPLSSAKYVDSLHPCLAPFGSLSAMLRHPLMRPQEWAAVKSHRGGTSRRRTVRQIRRPAGLYATVRKGVSQTCAVATWSVGSETRPEERTGKERERERVKNGDK